MYTIYNPNDTEFDPETFGFLPLERTGLEWVISPDEEVIFQEYGEKEISRSAANISYDNVLARLIDACSPDDQLKEDGTNKDQRVNQGHPTTIFGKYLFGRRFDI